MLAEGWQGTLIGEPGIKIGEPARRIGGCGWYDIRPGTVMACCTACATGTGVPIGVQTLMLPKS